MNTLPDKLSDLIDVALEDLTAVEQQPGQYVVRMGVWHVPTIDEGCAVCLAGAVMAMRLDTPRGRAYRPSMFPNDTYHKLVALDDVRVGEVWLALRRFYEGQPLPGGATKIPQRMPAYSYHGNPQMFRDDLRAIAARLREEGL